MKLLIRVRLNRITLTMIIISSLRDRKLQVLTLREKIHMEPIMITITTTTMIRATETITNNSSSSGMVDSKPMNTGQITKKSHLSVKTQARLSITISRTKVTPTMTTLRSPNMILIWELEINSELTHSNGYRLMIQWRNKKMEIQEDLTLERSLILEMIIQEGGSTSLREKKQGLNSLEC